eukprot:CAMPEP_0119211392 /NCGR_PEP_ID=MMETSP1327-20130426/2919_1 /TAXON_ID=38833 /ORGANISM="Micromonas pusilla, Strain RCC2306" /LENGTH=158 /DNA_ID=CAMNT_0007208521 /DNA_START=75 /DNA_END=551 /DNA_ORIENTATION=-
MTDPKNLKMPFTTSPRSFLTPFPTSPPGPASVSRKNSAQVSPTKPLITPIASMPTKIGGSLRMNCSKVTGTRSTSLSNSSLSISISRETIRRSLFNSASSFAKSFRMETDFVVAFLSSISDTRGRVVSTASAGGTYAGVATHATTASVTNAFASLAVK